MKQYLQSFNNKYFAAAKQSAALLLFFLVPAMHAQTISVHGSMQDTKQNPLYAVDVRVVDLQDTMKISFAMTDQNGEFRFFLSESHSYRLEATYVGYKKFVKPFSVGKNALELGALTMMENPITTKDVVIEGHIPAAEQHFDTTEYLAKAFKTHPDATSEELVTKMPGVTVDNSGTVKVGGETVQNILVDGKPYFSGDPTLALRNLPADVVEKIQVFDQMSDQAQFTGFDDGQSVKAMNIITRLRNGKKDFGKFTAGYGDDDRYIAGGSWNDFSATSQLSLVGLFNNINQQNYTAQDVLGTGPGSYSQSMPGGRRSGSSSSGGMIGRSQQSPGSQFSTSSSGFSSNNSTFASSQAQGINTTNMLGGNYVDSVTSNLFVQGGYFFTQVTNTNDQLTNRQYYSPTSSGTLYDQTSDIDSKNYNHRINARIDDKIDSSNSFIISPQLLFQQNNISNALDATSLLTSAVPLSSSQSSNQTDASGHNLTGHITYRHKFSIPGRTISLDIALAHNQRISTSQLTATTQQSNDSLISSSNEQPHSVINGYTISPTLT
ncbi:MAG TPA: carboxypeptidase-like regulatory domain-containing protein, partial [Bacteroidota bacterium]|nr:carboxypeptidase-like regulatory domain-containing protein [Bacteroidota bacterium]